MASSAVNASKAVGGLEGIADELRLSVIEMLAAAGIGHSAGPLGMAEILTALYFDVMVHDSTEPEWPDRDVLFLSNGHTAPILYAAMAHAGYFPVEELTTLRKYGSRLQGHPERATLPGLESTSGPLGSGLSQGAGFAYTLRLQPQSRRRSVFVVMGDGELNEGNVWEAAMFAAKYELGQLIGIVDRNFIQIDGSTEDVMPLGDLRAKWESFGWHVLEIDGNDVSAVRGAMRTAQKVVDKPSMIIALTVPGQGVPFMEYDYTWHGKPPSQEQSLEAITALMSKSANRGGAE